MFFRFPNQMTLGESETIHCRAFDKVLSQIIEHEENAAANFVGEKTEDALQHIGRAYGILRERAQHFVEGNDEFAFPHAFGVDLELFPAGGTRGGG